MKTFKLLLLTLLCLVPAFGQADSPELPSLPDPSSPLAERQLAYEKFSIQKIDGNLALISGKPYSKKDLYSLFKLTDSKDALRFLRSSKFEDSSALISPAATLAVGVAGGAVIGIFTWWFSGFYKYDPPTAGDLPITYAAAHRNTWIMGPCLAWGAGLGASIGAVEYLMIKGASKASFKKSAKLYNDGLQQRLQINVSPLPGGAVAGASLRF